MKSISKTFSQLKFNKLEKCNPKPGYKDSCEGCKNCKKGKGLMYEEGEQNPCCNGLVIPDFGNISVVKDYIVSNDFYYGNFGCNYNLQIKFETTGQWDDGMQLVYFNYAPIGAEGLTRNNWFSFNYYPNDGTLSISFANNLLVNKCITIHLKDTTCNINYGQVGELCSLMG